MIEGFPIAVMHKACGKLAFYASQPISPGDAAKSGNIRLPNGDLPGGLVVCGTCGQPIKGAADIVNTAPGSDEFWAGIARIGYETMLKCCNLDPEGRVEAWDNQVPDFRADWVATAKAIVGAAR